MNPTAHGKHRGSRKHILDWVEQPQFLTELLGLVQPVSCLASPDSKWMPTGHGSPSEARLETFGPRAYPGHPAWATLRSWWLRQERGANTPNWDLALACIIEGRDGLILVEAKANLPELSDEGKHAKRKASAASRANHDRIGAAIAEAKLALTEVLPGIAIDRDTHYQLSNRIAFAWKLASLGIPTVLMYLGFLGDSGIADVGEQFRSPAHWQQTFETHLRQVCPSPILDCPISAGPAPFWLLVRSKPVLEVSTRLSDRRTK